MAEVAFVEKDLPPVRLATLADRSAGFAEIGATMGPLFERLAGALGAAGAGASMAEPALATYQPDAEGVDIRVGWPTSRDRIAGTEVVELPGTRALTAVHRGSMEGLGAAWQALAEECGRRGLRFDGVGREVYHHFDVADPEACVTELQQPVA